MTPAADAPPQATRPTPAEATGQQAARTDILRLATLAGLAAAGLVPSGPDDAILLDALHQAIAPARRALEVLTT